MISSPEKQQDKQIIDSEEFLSLFQDLERHHSVFYKFWQIGKPTLDPKEETCSINYDSSGQYLDFIFNPKLWKDSSKKEKEFLICHECLHLILDHMSRISFKNDLLGEDNLAADIVVNHLLTKSFGFDRKDISFADELCWVNTVFKDGKNIPTDQSFEYYYNLIKEETKKEIQKMLKEGKPGPSNVPGISSTDGTGSGSGSDSKKPRLVDNHRNFAKKELPKDIVDQICKDLSEEEKKQLYDRIKDQISQDSINGDGSNPGGQLAGTQAGNHWLIVNLTKVKQKKKWETVIRDWSLAKTKIMEKDTEQWARLNRRFVLISNTFFIPTEMENENNEKDKMDVFFFLDSSGSCQGLAKRFFRAALSLPTERFSIQIFCFDTRVYEVNPKTQKLFGFGGTDFAIIEKEIQKQIQQKKIVRYPGVIFIVTDGYGSYIFPQYPKRFYWFLSENYKTYIPKESNVFLLKDYE